MAERSKSVTPLRSYGDSAWIVEWTGLTSASADTGDPFEAPGAADRSVQVTGTFGTGGTLVFEGSNDGTNWAVLTDPQGNALSFTSAKIESVTEVTRYMRPRITGGDGTTALVCTLLARRNY